MQPTPPNSLSSSDSSPAGSPVTPAVSAPGEFTGHPAYDTTRLRGDLERFIFLLGARGGEPLFGS